MAENPTNPTDKPAESTRDRILHAARDAWHESSFDGVGTAELCRRAGVHKGSFFHFFPSKQALLLAVLERHATDLDARLRQGPFAPDVPPLQRFERFFGWLGNTARGQLEQDGRFRGCPIGNLVSELGTRDDAARAAAAAVFDRLLAVFEETVREAVAVGELPAATDARTAAHAVLVWMQGLSVLAKSYGTAAPLGDLVARGIAMLRSVATGA
ncbi:MAG: TetR/AcrR family transcriptional regulator [Planctomycetes bacterium]|nr:TetR/AcrR family transcriptional regulator [Planctomycetota bacterium]